jgi:predicted TIM-barrel fold metal-dependent hydrolase
MRIIDVHAHIYPDSIADKAVENIGRFYGLPIEGHGKTSDLLETAKQFDVEKIVVCSVATSAKQVEHINDFMASQSSRSEFLPLATLHPDMEYQHIVDETARIKALGLHGIKLHPDFQAFKLCGEKGRKIFDAIGDFDMPILVHTGDKRLDFSHPEYMIEIARDYPRLTFIAAHMGGWSEWEQALKYKGLKNVMFDTSSSLAFLDKTVAKAVILGLGADKFMFGTDFPMWGYKTEIKRFLDLDLGEENNNMILFGNARKLYKLTI